ncbi:hypothetical protein EKO23_13410 [Nocardioides guangzhouensis]|uniref:Ubiquinone biosynthesis protein UbiA n=1 Tax=Nocardioides guangzhouensis TaxID=2497878 RepID=A0A4Q4ZBA4_9ACTN|nr:hypothetical protein [Nocardioides guangzhouensis]RYP85247.1 hypothetical protein EKO23_13410 [Nocardioides guangzhouensis]
MSPTIDEPAQARAQRPRARSGKDPHRPRAERGLDVRRSWPVALLRAGHLRQALLLTLVMGTAAALTGRSLPEVGLVAATILVGQLLVGWHNDVVDAARDRSHARDDKPIALGILDKGTATFAMALALLLVVPLSVANGLEAAGAHGGFLLLALLTNAGVLRRTAFSFLPWAAGFALLPAFLSYGGYAGEGAGGPPTTEVTVLAALLGIGVHVLRSLPGLVDDNKDGWRTFPLRVALHTGAPRLLVIGGLWTAAVSAGIVVAALRVGLVR